MARIVRHRAVAVFVRRCSPSTSPTSNARASPATALMHVCSTRLLTTRTQRLSSNGARRTGIIFGSPCRPRTRVQMADLRAFTRELMADAETDLGAQLDWVAVDHWNTDNPHYLFLVQGCAGDKRDLVISRDYISNGLREGAAERATLELGPRSELEIRDGLEKEVDAERWTSLDRSLRDISDESGGVTDLRPGGVGEDPELRRLMVGRAAKLERLGLAEQVGPALWTLKPGLEPALRDLGIRGDIIKTMHRAVMSAADRRSDVACFVVHGDSGSEQVLGRLVERGLHDELKGTALRHHRRHRRSQVVLSVFSRLGDDRGRQTRSHRRNADLRRRRRPRSPVAHHSIRPCNQRERLSGSDRLFR